MIRMERNSLGGQHRLKSHLVVRYRRVEHWVSALRKYITEQLNNIIAFSTILQCTIWIEMICSALNNEGNCANWKSRQVLRECTHSLQMMVMRTTAVKITIGKIFCTNVFDFIPVQDKANLLAPKSRVPLC